MTTHDAPMPAIDEALLKSWEGREQRVHDTIRPEPVAMLSATLDRDDPAPERGDVLPLGWHWMYFLEAARGSALGPDGHPARGGFLPPVPLPRRMWAGGRLFHYAPLRLGETVEKVSRVLLVRFKKGRSGPLIFVSVAHDFHADGALRLREEHDIVYRDAPKPGARAPVNEAAPGTPLFERIVTPDPVMLFRYSAVTFNGHRIHYDIDYCRDEEGYPGLVIHGPLTATLLMDLLRRETGDRPLVNFHFRAVKPLFTPHPVKLQGRVDANGAKVWALDHTDALAMEASADLG